MKKNKYVRTIKKKKKLKKFPIILLIGLFLVVILDVYLYFTSPDYNLKKKGYSDKNIEIMDKVLDNSHKNLILSFEYNKNILLILEDKNFKSENFEEYLRYYGEDNTLKYDTNILLIINDKYYLRANYERYIKYYEKNRKKNLRDIVENINCNLDKEYYTTDYEVDLEQGNLLLVNKYNKLDNEYVPDNLVKIDSKYGYSKQIDEEAYGAYIQMFDDANKNDKTIYITSAYRSYNYQKNLYNSYVSNSGKKQADRFSARPGYSEHQTGLAIDISSKNSPYTKFENTAEYQWMLKNSYKYGYILRYPRGKEEQTGYMFEAWHYRYVGKKVAKYIYDNKITYDEYYEYFIR